MTYNWTDRKIATNLVLDDKAGGGYALRITPMTVEELYRAFKVRFKEEEEANAKQLDEVEGGASEDVR
jgi:hypothetical protein